MRNNPSQGLLARTASRLAFGSLLLCFLSLPAASIAAKATSRPAPPPKAKAKATKSVKKKKKSAKKKPKGIAKKAIKQWLSLGPAVAPMPAFHKQKHGKFTYKHLLKSPFLQIKRLRPAKGQAVDWFVGPALRWNKAKGKATFDAKQAKYPHVSYLATYIEVDRYAEMSLKLQSHQRLQIFLNGRRVGGKAACTKQPKKKKGKKAKPTTARKAPPKRRPALRKPAVPAKGVLGKLAQLLERQNKIIAQQHKTIARQSRWLTGRGKNTKRAKKKRKPGKASALLRLTPGSHLLVIKSLYTPKCVRQWHVKAALHKRGKQGIPRNIRVATVPRERHSIGFLLRRARIGGISLSPDGQRVVLWKSRRTSAGKSIRWVELRQTSDGKLIRSTRPFTRLYALQWSPDGRYYSFVGYSRRRSATIWLANRRDGSIRALRRDIKQFRGYQWAPNSRFLIVNLAHKEKASKIEKIGAQRVRGMGDRWPWYRTHSHLYRLTLRGGQMLRLTAGRWSIWGPSIRHDGKKLLFLRSRLNFKQRPFRTADMFELDLTTLKTTQLYKDLRWVNSFAYSPDGKKILIRGGASLFGKVGMSSKLALGTVPNEYDTQAYIFDIKTKKATSITKQFKPSIRTAIWHPKDKRIYAVGLTGTRMKLYRLMPGNQWQHIPTGVDLTYRVAFARHSTRMVYLGQGIKHPGQLFTLDLAKPAPKQIHAPAKQWLGQLTLAKVKNFVTTSRRGHRIEGRVYYPPGFNPKKKYPAIVYYYGGTYPTTRSFDGRYPGHLWAAHDFIVYKLQPSGAIGYGQRFSARHVNEWGTIVPEEIIDATKDFIKAHPFVDGKRVGCIGASYGGFTTMSIVTKTKLFAAAVSHAGISNITSYWGAGFWGFLYSAVAGANRYPWTHPYFYVKQSPLFSAQKVTTPLLLLHGDSDTNVPPAESFQMYTALRLLQKKVELVLFKRENHWVLRYKKRILWTQTILAWFDKHLKKRPLWWKRLHGTRKH